MVIPELYIRKKWLSNVAKMNLKDQFKQTWNTYVDNPPKSLNIFIKYVHYVPILIRIIY
jgi:hypothetical protein